MPEPRGAARLVGEVLPRVYRWTMHDDRIDSQSDCYAVVDDGRVVLIDPLPMPDADLRRLGPIQAICLTASCHERAAWRYRRQYQVRVYGPAGGTDFEEPPDAWYNRGDHLPANLVAIHSPGPTDAHYSLYLERDGGAVFCADLLMNVSGDGLAFVPGAYQDDPAQTRGSVRHLLDLAFTALCPNHGDPLLQGTKEAIRETLRRDAQPRAGSQA